MRPEGPLSQRIYTSEEDKNSDVGMLSRFGNGTIAREVQSILQRTSKTLTIKTFREAMKSNHLFTH